MLEVTKLTKSCAGWLRQYAAETVVHTIQCRCRNGRDRLPKRRSPHAAETPYCRNVLHSSNAYFVYSRDFLSVSQVECKLAKSAKNGRTCKEIMHKGCKVEKGECVCGRLASCEDPFPYNSEHQCLKDLKGK